nr:hypothetical protein CTI12_AA260590 [Tanacetum cinerariifolium]
MNSTHPQRKDGKNVPTHGTVGISKAKTSIVTHLITLITEILHFHVNLVGQCYGMPRLLEEQPMPWTSHIQFVVVEVRKVDDMVNYGRGLFCYRIHGENYHRVGSLLPETGKTPKFAQLYIFDTDNEISNRIKAIKYSKESCTSSKDKKLDHQLATEIQDMLDSINPLVKNFAWL